MANDSVWEIVFLMVILKIPIVYLCLVIWWAIKAKPAPPEPATLVRSDGTEPGGPGTRRRAPGRLPRRPRGGPTRTYPRTPRTASVSARREVER